ncbi:hypothetical protein Hanom_Chr14g01313551 [Helianthus anomalus]
MMFSKLNNIYTLRVTFDLFEPFSFIFVSNFPFVVIDLVTSQWVEIATYTFLV